MANRSRIFLRGRLLQGPLVHAAALVAAAAQIKHRPSVLPMDIVILENVYQSAMLRLFPRKTIVEVQARLMRTASSICQGLQMIWRSPARARQ